MLFYFRHCDWSFFCLNLRSNSELTVCARGATIIEFERTLDIGAVHDVQQFRSSKVASDCGKIATAFLSKVDLASRAAEFSGALAEGIYVHSKPPIAFWDSLRPLIRISFKCVGGSMPLDVLLRAYWKFFLKKRTIWSFKLAGNIIWIYVNAMPSESEGGSPRSTSPPWQCKTFHFFWYSSFYIFLDLGQEYMEYCAVLQKRCCWL